jgi:hypothetical protein
MTLEQDSPLISEWLDGRLSADQADGVAAAVRSNPELAELVAQLRRLKTVLTEAGDQPVVPSPSLVAAVMSAVEGELPGDEDPLTLVSANGDSSLRPPHDETDEEVDDVVEEEWQRVEQQRVDQERAEAIEDEQAVLAASQTPGLSSGSDRRWLGSALGVALAAGLVVTVMLNLGGPPDNGGIPVPSGQDRNDAASTGSDIDPAALAERMIARGIELTEGRRSMGTLHMTVRLGDREGRRQFEELLARSRVRLDREETMPGGRVERIGCLGRAAEVDRLLETLAVSTGQVVIETGSLSREAIDRLERRGPVAEPVFAAADAQVETVTEPQPEPQALADAGQPAPAVMRMAAEPAPTADDPAASLAAADTATPAADATPPVTALAQADTPPRQARSLAQQSSPPGMPEAAGMARAARTDSTPPPAAMAAKSAPAAVEAAVEVPPPPPPQLIPPEGYVRLWIDIVDETRSSTSEDAAP